MNSDFSRFLLWSISGNLGQAVHFYGEKALSRMKHRIISRQMPEYLPLTPQIPEKFFPPLTSKKQMQWDQSFEDPEEFEALHRWGWLLINNDADLSASEYESWCAHFHNEFFDEKLRKSLRWEAYTISERLSNLFLFCQQSQHEISEHYKNLSRIQADILLENLEFFKNQTGNHVLNNARGLFFAERLTGQQKYRHAAEAILLNECEQLLPDGVLREGSTHYHFLIARWLIEIHLFSNSTKAKQFLERFLPKVLKACEQLMVQGSFPLFGDISPDCSPKELLDRPYFSGIKKSSYQGHARIGEWQRLENGPNLLFLSCRKMFRPFGAGHFHPDFFNFQYYYKGARVFAELGRKTYDPESFGLKCVAHNTLVINGHSLIPDRYRFYPPNFWNEYGSVDVIPGKDFSLASFKTLKRGIEIQRQLSISDKELNIVDTISSKSSDEVKRYFHFDRDVKIKIEDNSGTIISGENLGKFVLEGQISKIDVFENHPSGLGQQVIAYGESKPCQSLVVTSRTKPRNHTVSLTLRWN